MAKKPKTNQPETPDQIQERDLFETPRYATELIIPFIPKKVKTIWEPMCGSGRMLKVLQEGSGCHVFGTDIKSGHNVFDWEKFTFKNRPDCQITNPAFSIKRKIWDLFVEIDNPFALLIPADYSGWIIRAVRKQGAEKIIPERRIDYLTPNTLKCIHEGEVVNEYLRLGYELSKKKIVKGKKLSDYERVEEYFRQNMINRKYFMFPSIDSVPQGMLARYSTSQFHSMWLCYKFNIGRTETFVDLSNEDKLNIL